MPHIYLIIAVIAEVTATSCLKMSEGFTRPIPSFFVIVGFAIAIYCLSLVLKYIPVGVTYAIWSGLGIVFLSIISVVIYKQNLDLPAIIGIGLITAGVIVLNIFSTTVNA